MNAKHAQVCRRSAQRIILPDSCTINLLPYAAKRKEKKESRQQAVIADTSTILAGDTIKQWLQDASAIVRPSRRQAATDAFAARQGSEITAQFRKEAEKRLHAYENAMAKSNTDNSSMVGQLLFDNLVTAAPMLGPDGMCCHCTSSPFRSLCT